MFLCLLVYLFVHVLVTSHNNVLFKNILPVMYRWTGKSPLMFTSHRDLGRDQQFFTTVGKFSNFSR